MVNKDDLKEYAKKLMFDMKDDEYETLEMEFKIILKQMDLIGKIEGIKAVEPMTFPFTLDNVCLREDEINNTLNSNDIKINAKEMENNQVKVPKVVE